ncbi:MAG: lactonase family protein, partial [Hyphomicrobiales bacterium]
GDEISSLPSDWTGDRSGAAVRVHPNGRFGYMSNRGGHDSIFGVEIDAANLKLKPIGIWNTGGKVPRDFALDPSGRWLVVAHQDTSDLVVFAVDQATGALSETGHRLSTGSPVSVLFL